MFHGEAASAISVLKARDRNAHLQSPTLVQVEHYALCNRVRKGLDQPLDESYQGESDSRAIPLTISVMPMVYGLKRYGNFEIQASKVTT